MFFSGGSLVSNSGTVKIVAFVGIGAVALVLLLYPLMRAFVVSKVEARSLDPEQRAIVEMIPSPIFFLNTWRTSTAPSPGWSAGRRTA